MSNLLGDYYCCVDRFKLEFELVTESKLEYRVVAV